MTWVDAITLLMAAGVASAGDSCVTVLATKRKRLTGEVSKMPLWRCKNSDCKRTFQLYARISLEKKLTNYEMDYQRVIVEKPCCPFCESIEFEEVKA